MNTDEMTKPNTAKPVRVLANVRCGACARWVDTIIRWTTSDGDSCQCGECGRSIA